MQRGTRSYQLPPNEDRQRRSLTIQFLDEASLQSYLETHAAGLVEQLQTALGADSRIESRVLRPQGNDLSSPASLSALLELRRNPDRTVLRGLRPARERSLDQFVGTAERGFR